VSRWRRRRVPPSIRFPKRWRRVGWATLALFVLTGLLGYDRWAHRPAGEDFDRYHHQEFRVSRVVDGDTLDVECPDGAERTTRIRLWGVDTPEVGRGERHTMYFGERAREFAEQTLAGRSVRLVLAPEQSRDKYGRLLAYVYLERGGPSFNEMILEQGYGYADPRFPHPWRKDFSSMESRARKSRVGLWANVRIDQMPAWRQRLERGDRQGG
jgi:micrococcal nuclease